MAGATTQGANLLIRGNLTIHSHSHTVGAATGAILGLSVLPKEGHIDIWTGGAANRTANLPIGGRLLYLLPTAAQDECVASAKS